MSGDTNYCYDPLYNFTIGPSAARLEEVIYFKVQSKFTNSLLHSSPMATITI
jgi:hypothetical protein